MFRLSVLLLCAAPVAAQEAAEPTTEPSTASPAPIVIERPASPLADALGRAVDPPVCCQLAASCSPGSPGTTTGELRSLCMAAGGQPLTGQYCHSDGACRP